LLAVMGNVHRYGDRRMPVPGVIGIAAAVVSAVFAAGAAVGLLVVWLALYLLVSAPINRQLTAASDQADLAVDARALQHKWDSIITIGAVLQGLAVTALCTALPI
jgi:hypothetical protein